MSTARRTWQKAEGRAAAMFAASRQPGSGCCGQPDLTRSDSTHSRLFIECKLRERHATRSLHDATRLLAVREGKTPVLALFDKNRPGCLLCVHSDDFAAVVIEYAAAHADDLEGPIRRAFARQRGEELPREW
jgi:hypothetical protein